MTESIGAEGVVVRLAQRIAQLEVDLAVAQSQLDARHRAEDDGYGIEAVPDMPPKGEDK